MHYKQSTFLVPTIFAIALALRMSSLTFGFPFIFHPDEPAVIRTALGIKYFPNPGHFDWPHLYMYLNFIVYMVFGKLRALLDIIGIKETMLFPYLKLFWDEGTVYYLLTRALSALFGALTVIPIYLTANLAFGKRVGLLAALALAVTPFHVRHSHYALIDVPMMFFASWAIYFSTKLLLAVDTTYYAGAGFYTGLAASIKYNGALTALTVPIAHLLRVVKNKEKLFTLKAFSNLGIATVSCVLAFIIGTPYAVLDYNTFSRTDGPKGAFWQFTNVGSLDLDERIPAFINAMLYKVADDLGYTILIGFGLTLVLVGFKFLTKRNTPQDVTLLFFLILGLFLLAYVSGLKNSRSHYYFVAYPYVIVCFAYMLDVFIRNLSKVSAVFGILIFLTALGIPSFLAIKNSYVFVQNDTRVSLFSWLKTTLSPQDYVFYTSSDYRQVVDKIPNTKTKGVPSTKLTRSGILIKSREYRLEGNRSFHPVKTFDNTDRLGPYIEVFSFNK